MSPHSPSPPLDENRLPYRRGEQRRIDDGNRLEPTLAWSTRAHAGLVELIQSHLRWLRDKRLQSAVRSRQTPTARGARPESPAGQPADGPIVDCVDDLAEALKRKAGA